MLSTSDDFYQCFLTNNRNQIERLAETAHAFACVIKHFSCESSRDLFLLENQETHKMSGLFVRWNKRTIIIGS